MSLLDAFFQENEIKRLMVLDATYVHFIYLQLCFWGNWLRGSGNLEE
jgi:hypothetical protein